MIDYYEDWCNEVLSWNTTRDPDTNIVHNATRKSLHLDSRAMFDQEMRIRSELISCGGARGSCYNCRKNNVNSINTTYINDMWVCKTCGETWDPLKLRFKGF